MYKTLKKISEGYQSSEELRTDSEDEFGLEFEEAIEMAYDNIQSEATFAIKNIKPL